MIKTSSLRHWVRTHVSWQLALALCISLLVHVFLLEEAAWQSWFADDAPTSTLLQAHLEMPPPKPVKAAAVDSVAPKKSPAVKPQKAPPAPDHLPPSQKESPPVTADAVAPVEAPSEEDTEAIRQAEIEAWHASDHSGIAEPDESLPPPYQRVSTDFSVYVNGEERPAGSAKIEYVQEAEGQYALRWTVEGRGLLKLLYPTLEQQSHGDIDQYGLKPRTYRYAFGDRASKIYEASFDWETNFITLKTAKGEQRQDLPRNTQDILSFMYQFMFVPPLQEMQVSLTNGRRLNTYQYEFEGEDSLVINDQAIATVHIAHTRGESDEKIELWLAKDYRYVPVKIRKLEKNGMVIEQVATRLVTE